MYFPIISYSVSAFSPIIVISPEFVYVLLKYIFPFLYISNVGASTILPAGSFICKLLFAVYTSALKSSTVTSGFMYSAFVCSLFSGFGSCGAFGLFSSFSALSSLLSSLVSSSIISSFSTVSFAFSIPPTRVNTSS